ncbi:DUF1109 domain-containing protein [Ramlibacter sp. AN1133]|uniref:DUF1109 domain-containing protein n=1 Tax=Ramlibacter sp. AN1133 TaxID=3133429 RepID=UPI0030C33A64
MKTEELVALLATQAQPVPRGAARRRLGLALLAALPLSLALMLAGYGPRPGLVASLGGAMAWIKILLPAAIAAAGFVALQRLGRPGVRVRGAWAALAAPVLVLWLLGLLAWWAAAPQERPALLWGSTWRTCVFNIGLMATPFFLAALLALRSLAPTRPMLAGAVAGATAGGAGAAVYALHCPELGAPFLAVWYVLGIALPAALGALAGRSLLRW